MPSLSASKPEPMMVPTDITEFSKSMTTMMEKKIRNLEKRRSRLEDYKNKQKQGETLTEEQLKAVARLDDVLSQIDLLQDLIKQFNQYNVEAIKQQRKQAKKERYEQVENERRRITDILQVQNVLLAMGDESNRQAFVDGSEGTVKLEQTDLDQLDQLYKLINPEPTDDSPSSKDQFKKAAEHLQALLDGRDKPVCGTTYRQLNDLISKIKECPFFSQSKSSSNVSEAGDGSTEKEFVVVEAEEVPEPNSVEVQSSLPPSEIHTQPEHEESEQSYQHTITDDMHENPPAQPKSFEQIVGNVQGQFNFIQESEIDVDSPSNVDPAVLSVHQIPSQYQPATAMNQQHAPDNIYAQQQHHQEPQYQQYIQNAHQTASYHKHDTPTPPSQHMPLPDETNHSHNVQSQIPSSSNTMAEPVYHQTQIDSSSVAPDNTYQQNVVTGHPDQQHNDEFSQSRPMRNHNNNSGGTFRGRRGFSNGYGHRGSGQRGGLERNSNYRNDRGQGSGPSENRRNNRGAPRGGFRGGPRGGRGGNFQPGRFRGSSNQPTTHQH